MPLTRWGMIESRPDVGRYGTLRDGVIIPDAPLRNPPDGTRVKIELTPRDHLLSLVGIWKDDPYWEEFLREWYISRGRLDEDGNELGGTEHTQTAR